MGRRIVPAVRRRVERWACAAVSRAMWGRKAKVAPDSVRRMRASGRMHARGDRASAVPRPRSAASAGRRRARKASPGCALNPHRTRGEAGLFYYFVETFVPKAIDLRESHALMAQICRSAVVQVSWLVEVTSVARRGEAAPITPRWLEAAGCASVVVGAAPEAADFEDLLPYPHHFHEVDSERPRSSSVCF